MKKRHLTLTSYLLLTFLFILNSSLVSEDYSFWGYYSDKVLNWVWLVFTLIVFVWFWKKRATQIYFVSLLTLLILSILPMGIPFFAIIDSFLPLSDHQQITLNREYRIDKAQGLLGGCRVCVYKRIGILEKNICKPVYYRVLDRVLGPDSDTVYAGSKIHIVSQETPIQSMKFINANNDSIGIEYQILGKKKVIYHKLNHDDRYWY